MFGQCVFFIIYQALFQATTVKPLLSEPSQLSELFRGHILLMNAIIIYMMADLLYSASSLKRPLEVVTFLH